MDGDHMPMFPLGTVLFPGQLLPLHVFEPQYVQMLDHCLSTDREFGVVLIERGRELGGGDVRAPVGTVARIVDAAEAGPGRWAVLSVGTRRIRVRRWHPNCPWPNAEVEDLPDESSVDNTPIAQLWTDVQEDFRRIRGLAVRIAGSQATAAESDDDPATGCFHLAALSPLGPFDRQRVLAAVGVEHRLRLLGQVFGEVEETLLATLAFGGEFDL